MSGRPDEESTADGRESTGGGREQAGDPKSAGGRGSTGGLESTSGDQGSADGDHAPDGADRESDMGDLFDELAELEAIVDSAAEREQVHEAMEAARAADRSGVFGRVVFGFDRSDAAEALLGALLFGIPMFVEDGTKQVGEYVASHPAYLLATNLLAVGLVVGILYVADFQDVRVHDPILGVFPRKLVGVLAVSSLTAVFMMTAWGRVDWARPWLALCTVSVAFVPMAIGAALGDLLPG